MGILTLYQIVFAPTKNKGGFRGGPGGGGGGPLFCPGIFFPLVNVCRMVLRALSLKYISLINIW